MTSSNIHYFPVRVYYNDTDAGGMVYHAHYLTFAENARSEFLRAIGIEQNTLYHVDHCLFVVRRIQVDYKLPAKLDDLLRVESLVTKAQGARVEFLQNIMRDEKILVTLHVEIAFINAKGVPKKIPEGILQKLVMIEKS